MGVTCELLDERHVDRRDITCPIVFAPHEFLGGAFEVNPGRLKFVHRAILFCTEQMQTQWFRRQMQWLYAARAVIDINFQTACMLNRCGIRATNVMLPFDDALVRKQLAGVDRKHPLLSYHDPKNLKSMFEEKDFADRPVDIFSPAIGRRCEKRCFPDWCKIAYNRDPTPKASHRIDLVA